MTDFEKMQGLLQEKKDAENLISETYKKIESISQAQVDLLNEIIEKNFPKGYVSFKEDANMHWFNNRGDLKGKDAYIKATSKKSSYSRNCEVYIEAFRMDSKGNLSKKPERLWEIKIEKDIIEQILVIANPYQKEIVNEFENPDLLKKHLQKLVKEMYDKEFFFITFGKHKNIRFSDRFICNYLDIKKWQMTPEQYEEAVKGLCTCGCIEFNYDMWYAKNITATFFDALQDGRVGYVDGYLKGMEAYYTKKGLTHEAEFLNELLDWGKEKTKELEEDYVNSYKDEDEMER